MENNFKNPSQKLTPQENSNQNKELPPNPLQSPLTPEEQNPTQEKPADFLGRETKNESVYNASSTNKENLQDIKTSAGNALGAEVGSKIPESNVVLKNHEKKLKLWVVIFSVFLVLLLAVAGVSFAKGDLYWVRDILGFGLPSDPVKAVLKVSQNMSKLKTYRSNFNTNLDIATDSQKISGKIEGQVDFDKANNEAKLNFKVKDLNLPDNDKGSFDFLKALNNVEGDLITTKTDLYFKSPLLKDKWQKIDFSKFTMPQQLSKGSISDEDAALVAGTVIYSDGVSKTGLSDLGQFVKSAKKLNDEKISGESTYHYTLELDLAKAVDMNESFKQLPEFNKEVIKNFISKYLSLKIDYWVKKSDFLIKKQNVALDIKVNGEDFGLSGVLKFGFTINEELKDYNKALTIEKPQDTQDFDLAPYLKLLSGNGQTGLDITNSLRRSDMMSIKAALEAYYAKNKKYPVYKGDSRNSSFLKELVDEGVIVKVPKDPQDPTYYYYYESADGSTYKLTCVITDAQGGFKIEDFSKK